MAGPQGLPPAVDPARDGHRGPPERGRQVGGREALARDGHSAHRRARLGHGPPPHDIRPIPVAATPRPPFNPPGHPVVEGPRRI